MSGLLETPITVGGRGEGRPGDRVQRAAVTLGVVLAALAAVIPPSATDPGTTRWVLGAVDVTVTLAACGTVGSLLLTRLLTAAGRSRDLAPARTSTWAWAWCVASLVSAWLQVSVIGPSLSVILPDSADPFVWSLRATVTTAWAAALLAVLVRRAATPRDDLVLLLLAVLAVTPGALGGHATQASWIAVTALVVHVVALTLWCGGLFALLVHAAPQTRRDPAVLRRFSSVALLGIVAVVESGVVASAAQHSPSELLASGTYVRLLAVKVTLLCLVALVGLQHRRSTLARMAAGDPAPFWRLAAGEVVLLTVLVGLGVALTHVVPPVSETDGGVDHQVSRLLLPTAPSTHDPGG